MALKRIGRTLADAANPVMVKGVYVILLISLPICGLAVFVAALTTTALDAVAGGQHAP